jgi:hypothetical protein
VEKFLMKQCLIQAKLHITIALYLSNSWVRICPIGAMAKNLLGSASASRSSILEPEFAATYCRALRFFLHLLIVEHLASNELSGVAGEALDNPQDGLTIPEIRESASATTASSSEYEADP